MKVKFPCYAVAFPCACTGEEAVQKISETAACPGNNLKVIDSNCSGDLKIVLSAVTDSYAYYNSFLPAVTVEIGEPEGQTRVSVLFELKKSIKVLMSVLCAFALVYELTLIVLWLTNQLASLALLCIPLGMLILGYGLSAAGFFFSAKGVLRVLFTALTHEDGKCAPPIHRSKYIE